MSNTNIPEDGEYSNVELHIVTGTRMGYLAIEQDDDSILLSPLQAIALNEYLVDNLECIVQFKEKK